MSVAHKAGASREALAFLCAKPSGGRLGAVTCAKILLLIEAELEDALREVRDWRAEERDLLRQANLDGRLLAYERALKCVREARETWTRD